MIETWFHDFTKLEATQKTQHLNSVTQSVNPCLDLFHCLLVSFTPKYSHGSAALYMTITWLCFGRPVTHSTQNCHSHSPAHRNDTFIRVSLCVYTLPVTPERSVSGAGCERAERLRMTALQESNTLFANANAVYVCVLKPRLAITNLRFGELNFLLKYIQIEKNI